MDTKSKQPLGDEIMKEAKRMDEVGFTKQKVIISLCVLLIAFSLRTAITSVGAILPEIMNSISMSHVSASALTTTPLLAFALVSPVGPRIVRRLGIQKTLSFALVIMVIGMSIRVVPTWPALISGQVVACLAIGVLNVLLPGVVKRFFPLQVPLMTGLYSASMNAGGALAAAMSAPTSHFIGRTFDVDATMAWPLALFVWVIPVLLATSLWQAPGLERGPSNNAKRVLWKDIGRNRLAWSVTLFFGFQASLAYIVYGWLGWVLRNRGCSAVEAGLAVAVSVVCQSLASIIFPFLSRRWRSQRCPNVIAIFATRISLIGCLYAPVGLVSVCAVMLGLAQGTAFTLALTVIGLRSDTTDVAEALSSMAQGVGYGVAGIGPFIAGFLLRSAESMNGLAYLCIIIGLLAAFFGFLAGKNAAVTVRAD